MKTASPSTRTASRSLRAAKKSLPRAGDSWKAASASSNSLAKTVTDALAGAGSPYGGAPEKLLEDLGRGDSAAIAATDGALNNMRAQLTGGIAQAQSKIDEMQDQLVTVNTAIDQLSQIPPEYMTPEQKRMLAEAQAAKPQLEAGIATAQATKAELEENLSQLNSVSASSHRREQAGAGRRLERVLQRARPSSTRAERSCATRK